MRLLELRTARGLSQKALATALGCSQNMVSQWENGTRDPSTQTLKQMADFFGVSIDYLLGYDVPMENIPDDILQLACQIKKLPPNAQDVIERQLKLFADLDK